MNSAWTEIFSANSKKKTTINCEICTKAFTSNCGLAVHVTKIHRKAKAPADDGTGESEPLQEEKKEQIAGSKKKRRQYSLNFKKTFLSELENQNPQERKEFLKKCKVPQKTVEKWRSPATKRQILKNAIVRPFKKRRLKTNTKK